MVEQEFTTEELANEIWRPIVGYEGVYSVSDLGRIRRDRTRNGAPSTYIRRQIRMPNGYRAITLRHAGTIRRVLVHRLVAFAFIGMPPDGKPQVNHLDCVRANNRVANLEWASPADDGAHRVRMGRVPSGDRQGLRRHPERAARGERHGNSKLTDDDVRAIRRLVHGDMTQRCIAQLFRVSTGTVSLIKHRHAWAHVCERGDQ